MSNMTIEKAIGYWKARYENTKYFDDVHCDADELREHEEYVEVLKETITALEKQIPKSEPKEKTGQWEIAIGYDIERTVMCDQCRRMAYDPSNYCPYCGAKMEVKENAET